MLSPRGIDCGRGHPQAAVIRGLICDRLGDRSLTGDQLEGVTRGRRGVEYFEQDGGDVRAGDVTSPGLIGQFHPSRPRVVRQMTGAYDSDVECIARADHVVRVTFRAQVGDEHRITDLVRRLDVGSHCRNHDVPPRARGLSSVCQQDGGVTVDGLLARRSAAGPRTRGEHDRIGTPDVRRNVGDRGFFEVHHHRLGARGFEVGDMVRVPDQPDCRVAAVGEQPFEDEGDLAVPTGDDDAHASTLAAPAGRVSAPCRSCSSAARRCIRSVWAV
jgi:hypothetical protein